MCLWRSSSCFLCWRSLSGWVSTRQRRGGKTLTHVLVRCLVIHRNKPTVSAEMVRLLETYSLLHMPGSTKCTGVLEAHQSVDNHLRALFMTFSLQLGRGLASSLVLLLPSTLSRLSQKLHQKPQTLTLAVGLSDRPVCCASVFACAAVGLSLATWSTSCFLPTC